MHSVAVMERRLGRCFPPEQASVLAEVIEEAHKELVKTSDFNELKEIVRDIGVKVGELADAQRRTDQKMGELAEAQKRTEVKVEELAEAQKRTDQRVGELAEAQKRTEIELKDLVGVVREGHRELGGLSASFSYAFENEAYRLAPRVLEERHGITLREKMIREVLDGEEVNLLGRGTRGGKEVWVVGEAKVRLDVKSRKRGAETVFDQLERKVAAVRAKHGSVEIVPLLVAHLATPAFLAEAKRRGVLVIQSFEW